MLITKVFLLLLPIFVYRSATKAMSQSTVRLTTSILAILALFMCLSPYSFIGWVMDVILISMLIMFALALIDNHWTRRRRTTVILILVSLVISSALISYRFGREFLRSYQKDNLVFSIYYVPDTFASHTYDLEIKQPLSLFERDVYGGKVKAASCTFDYDTTLKTLIPSACD